MSRAGSASGSEEDEDESETGGSDEDKDSEAGDSQEEEVSSSGASAEEGSPKAGSDLRPDQTLQNGKANGMSGALKTSSAAVAAAKQPGQARSDALAEMANGVDGSSVDSSDEEQASDDDEDLPSGVSSEEEEQKLDEDDKTHQVAASAAVAKGLRSEQPASSKAPTAKKAKISGKDCTLLEQHLAKVSL